MDTKMTRAARAELADVVRRRYSAAASKDKRRILDEFIAATGYHEGQTNANALECLDYHAAVSDNERRGFGPPRDRLIPIGGAGRRRHSAPNHVRPT
jgi:hypothetical protein